LFSLIGTHKYRAEFIYNLDETSLLVKVPTRPAVVYKRSMCTPCFSREEAIFASTAIFIVDASGGICPTTLILNEKAVLKYLETETYSDMDIRFLRMFCLCECMNLCESKDMLCVCVFLYLFVCVCVSISLCVCVCFYISLCVCFYISLCVCFYISLCVCVHICMCVNISV
jgi:hypothetical protein